MSPLPVFLTYASPVSRETAELQRPGLGAVPERVDVSLLHGDNLLALASGHLVRRCQGWGLRTGSFSPSSGSLLCPYSVAPVAPNPSRSERGIAKFLSHGAPRLISWASSPFR